MFKAGLMRVLLAGAAMGAAPAQAVLSVHYDGQVLLHYQTSTGQVEPGAMNGNFAYRASFYYDDFGDLLATTLSVAGVVREHFDYCPSLGLYCPPLVVTPTSIGSGAGTTPEDYAFVGVYSPGQFGGTALFGAGSRTYVLVPGDDSQANLSWALFDNASGYAWNSGSGTVDQITAGVPEPASWALMIAGFGLTGTMMRRLNARRPVDQPPPSAVAPTR